MVRGWKWLVREVYEKLQLIQREVAEHFGLTEDELRIGAEQDAQVQAYTDGLSPVVKRPLAILSIYDIAILYAFYVIME